MFTIGKRDRIRLTAALVMAFSLFANMYASSDSLDDCNGLSLENLFNMKVTIATKTGTSMSKVPASVTIITKEQIALTPARDLCDLITTYVPDAMFTRHEGPRLGIRGILIDRNYKILLLVNGKYMNERIMDGAATEISNWDLNDIERVEVIRGPGSVTYGPGAIAGVINIITKKCDTEKKKGVTVGSAPDVTYGSYGGFAEFNYAFDRVKLYGYGSIRSSSGLSDPDFFVNGRNVSYAGEPGKDFPPAEMLRQDRPGPYAPTATLTPVYKDPDGPQLKAHINAELFDDWRVWARFNRMGTAGLVGVPPYFMAMAHYNDGEYLSRAFDRQEIVGQVEYTKKFSDLYTLKGTAGANIYDMIVYMSDDSTKNHDEGYASEPAFLRSMSGNLVYGAREQNVQLTITNNVTLRNDYVLSLGFEASYDRLLKSKTFGAGLDHGPALQLTTTMVKNNAGADSASFWNLIGSGFSTYLFGAFAEANLPLRKYFTFLGSIRTDKHQWTGWMWSPRIALISEINGNNVIKAIIQQSVRMNLLPEAWMAHVYEDWTGKNNSEYEKILTYELAYSGLITTHLGVNGSLFINENEALGWVIPSNAAPGNYGYQAPIGKSRVGGGELELKLDLKNAKVGLMQSYTRLLKFTSANRNAVQGLSVSDYNVSIGNNMYLTSTGKDLNNWANIQTKLYGNVKLLQNLTLGTDIQVYWAYEGYKDAIDMYKKAYAVSTLPAASVDSLRNVITRLEDAGCGGTNIRMNLSLAYKIPFKATDVTLRAYAMNLLGTYKTYFNATRIDGVRPSRLGWWNEPASFGGSVTVGF